MGAFNVVTKAEIDAVQVNAGMLLKSFTPSAPAAPSAENIIGATTGGITCNVNQTFEDFGADIDNCPDDVLEMKRITKVECTFSCTFVSLTEEVFKLSLGAASKLNKEITPVKDLIPAHFTDIWFVSEKVNDQIIAINLKNALSTGGFSYKTGKNAKGQLTVTFTGHASINDPDKLPIQFYFADAPEDGGVSGMSLDDEG